jgi:hypothetical protein
MAQQLRPASRISDAQDLLKFQEALLEAWHENGDYTFDPNKTPKANFARLAKANGWVGGDTIWCENWETCFCETYPYGAKSKPICFADRRDAGNGMRGSARDHMLTLGLDRGASAKAEIKVVKKQSSEGEKAVINAKAETKMAKKVAETIGEKINTAGLEESMRRLSVGSDESDFSLVSRTSRTDSFDSVRSLDSVRSANSISLPQRRSRKNSTESWNSQDLGNSVLSLDTVKSLDSIFGGVNIPENISEPSKNMDTDTGADIESQEDNGNEDEEDECNPAWYDYGNFEPEPTAPFRTEFERLARYKGWGSETKRYHLINILSEEVAFLFGDGEEKLHDFQDLCEDLGIEDVPSTLTQCRKVSTEDINTGLE